MEQRTYQGLQGQSEALPGLPDGGGEGQEVISDGGGAVQKGCRKQN